MPARASPASTYLIAAHDGPPHAAALAMERTGTMTMTWEVTAVNAGTRVDIRTDDVPDGIPADDHAAGLTSLAKLGAYLEQRPTARNRPFVSNGTRTYA
jgi:hypothetical protein